MAACTAAPADCLPPLSHEEIRRYSRHLLLDDVGMEGQRRLKGSSVLCIGGGGLGSPLLMYLAAAGVGTIGIVDDDVVEESNLQRQIVHATDAVGTPKVDSARTRIAQINPHVAVVTHQLRLDATNALELMRPYDCVVDGSDNFPTRYLVNDACVLTGKPLVYGAVQRFEGQLSVFNYRGGPNYRDLFPEPPPPGSVPSCAEAGVVGVLPGVIGVLQVSSSRSAAPGRDGRRASGPLCRASSARRMIRAACASQATEALKVLLGRGEVLSGRLVVYDAMAMAFTVCHRRLEPQAWQTTSSATPAAPHAPGPHTGADHPHSATRGRAAHHAARRLPRLLRRWRVHAGGRASGRRRGAVCAGGRARGAAADGGGGVGAVRPRRAHQGRGADRLAAFRRPAAAPPPRSPWTAVPPALPEGTATRTRLAAPRAQTAPAPPAPLSGLGAAPWLGELASARAPPR